MSLVSACASVPSPQPAAAKPGANAELAALRAQHVEQTQRIAELEARLSLLEADARRERDSTASATLRGGESVRIGAHASRDVALSSSSVAGSDLASRDALAEAEAEQTNDDDDGKRPSLRLYGSERSTAPKGRRTSDGGDLPAVPAVSERLPVVPLPEQRAGKALRGPAPEAIDQYRSGLRSLQARHFDDALEAFGAFVSQQPTHALVPSALYWRGEAHYALRDYKGARKEFEGLLARFPAADRAPDALLKLGLSLRKLGAGKQANAIFERLRKEHPNSQAAQAAAREGST